MLTSAGEPSSFATFHPTPQSALTLLYLNTPAVTIAQFRVVVSPDHCICYLVNNIPKTTACQMKSRLRSVSSEQRVQVKEKILAFCQEVLKAAIDPDHDTPISTNWNPSPVVESIVDNSEYIFTVEELEEMCGMWNS